MVNTKQFTIFFLLVVVFLVAIMIVTNLALRESTKTYDTTSIRNSLTSIVNLSATKIKAQETAMQAWVDEVDVELNDVEAQIALFQTEVDTAIPPAPAPIP